MQKILFAPLQGYTEDAYRRFHNEIFGGIDTYYTPFVRLEHGKVRSKDMRDIRPEYNEGVNIVPQVIASGAEELHTLLDVIIPLGYKKIDINMGCPFPLQTRHGRGAGLLASPDRIREITDCMNEHDEMDFSVKMRLGLDDANQWKAVIPILNDVPLTHITVHPRIATQQYKGEIDMDSFRLFADECRHPLVYNGEIHTVEDIHRIENEFGDRLAGIMIGRGLLARPSLAREYKDGATESEASLVRDILRLHDMMQAHYAKMIPGEDQQLGKLRTFWDHLEPTIGRKQWKKIVKAGNMKNYLAAVRAL